MARRGKEYRAYRATHFVGSFPSLLPAWLRCGAPLALGNASEVPVLPAEEQISDFARDDNATDAERRGFKGSRLARRLCCDPSTSRQQRRWCSGPDGNLHLRKLGKRTTSEGSPYIGKEKPRTVVNKGFDTLKFNCYLAWTKWPRRFLA